MLLAFIVLSIYSFYLFYLGNLGVFHNLFQWCVNNRERIISFVNYFLHALYVPILSYMGWSIYLFDNLFSVYTYIWNHYMRPFRPVWVLLIVDFFLIVPHHIFLYCDSLLFLVSAFDLFRPKTSTFLHARSSECTSKLRNNFLNQFLVHFDI